MRSAAALEFCQSPVCPENVHVAGLIMQIL
jgi:hypothetical protein